MTSSFPESSDDSAPHEQQCNSPSEIQQQSHATENFQTSMGATSADYVMPQMAHTVASRAYPYLYPYYGGILAAYGGQPTIQPPIMGMHHAGVPLPTNTIEETIFVNAKQYHGILRRRESRAKAELKNKLIKSRKPYLHESRHLHALNRARGCGGRFLNTKVTENQDNEVLKPSKTHHCNSPSSQNSAFIDQQNPDLSQEKPVSMNGPESGKALLSNDLDSSGATAS